MLNGVTLERGAPGGELLNTELIEDYPGFESILGWELAEKMDSHAKKFGANIVTATVTRVRRLENGLFETSVDSGDSYLSPAVIVTAGGTPVKLGVPGEAEYAGKGVSYCAVCDGAFFKGHTVAVVGGGDAAVEEAAFLTRFAEKVYLVHRRDTLRASAILQQRLMQNPKVEILWNKVVESIEADADGLVKQLNLSDTATDEKSVLTATGVFIFIGFTPNTGIIDGHVDHDSMGYIVTDANMQTAIPGLFAAGDLRSQLTRQITTAAGDGTTAAIAVEKFLTARKDAAAGAAA
jgi:thioredoxin reductase (NADPH)